MTDSQKTPTVKTIRESRAQDDNQVVIVEYNPLWPVLFEEERARILDLINRWAESVEHIGSTSVPGLGAKPIIDIMVGLRSLDDARHCIPLLEAIGYEYVSRHEAVMPERRYLHKGPSRYARTHHLHMVETSSEFWEKHIRFRDYLRTHEETTREYYELKKQLAARFRSDRESYTNAKTSFIEAVVARGM